MISPRRPPGAGKRRNWGDTDGQLLLAKLFRDGKGVEKNEAKSLEWALKAAEQGRPEAPELVGQHHTCGGDGISTNLTEATEWYRKAAEDDDAQAQFELGRRYCRGDGVKKDVATGIFWCRKAARNGSSAAKVTLALLYEIGQETEADPK